MRCRTCAHPNGYHDVLGTQCMWIVDCNCKGFVTPNNLDYIEWLVKKRGLV